jgi:hypothetical protein
MMHDRMERGRLAGLLLAAACVVSIHHGSLAQALPDKPRVPPGVDPGGLTVAIVGNGIDYTRPEIAARLARDGEGEIVGWDFVDGDRRPHGVCAARASVQPTCPTLHASRIVSETRLAGGVRVMLLRASADRPQTMVEAVQLAAAASARIVVLVTDEATPIPRQFVIEAAGRFPDRLVIAEIASLGPDAGPELVEGNLRIVRHADAHSAEGVRILSGEKDLDAAALNRAIYGGAARPGLKDVSPLPGRR